MRSKRFSWLYSLIAIWGGGIGCADKIDPSLLDTSLRDAQNIISDTRLSGAEEYAGEQLANAVRLVQESQQAQQAGNGVESLELAFQAQIEARVAGALARQKIAQNRINQARENILKTMAQEMEFKVQTAQAGQTIAEEREGRALSIVDSAEQRMITAQAEADVARRDAQHTRFSSQVQLAIGKAQLVLDTAKTEGASTYDVDGYQGAENLIRQALSLLVQEKFDEAKAAAVKAEEHANKSRIAAGVGVKAGRLVKLEDYAAAKVAITRAQIEIDRAESVNAFAHTETLFERANTTLERANLALKTEKYKQALQLAAQAESIGYEAYTAAEVIERKQSAKGAMEEQIAKAKDTIFKAEERINQAGGTEMPNLASEPYKQAVALLAEAKDALCNTNYKHATASGQQSLETLTNAIENAKQIEAVETRILNATQAIPEAETENIDKGVLVRFSGNLFKPGGSEINPKSLPMLQQLAEILNTFADYRVRVEAHSDGVGKTDTNLKLTENRANVFTKYLSEKGGVPSKRITSIGVGENYPIASNANKAGRDKNRRIDTIILTRE